MPTEHTMDILETLPQNSHELSLTDYETLGLYSDLNLADGHAYHDSSRQFPELQQELPKIWEEATRLKVHECEILFREEFAKTSGITSTTNSDNFRILPTASNTIDMIATVLREKNLRTTLVEPTFDNIALLLRRHKVALSSIDEINLISAIETKTLHQQPTLKESDALFLVNPNNPTATVISQSQLGEIVEYCLLHRKTILIDNTFRLFNTDGYDDYKLLIESGVSFIAFEDTGKVWPTHDLKTSLVFYSHDHKDLLEEIYGEIYLCHSRFAMILHTHFAREARRIGLEQSTWSQVRERKQLLHTAIHNTELTIVENDTSACLPMAWIDISRSGVADIEMVSYLGSRNIQVLPGRNFYWNSINNPEHQKFIRIALFKPLPNFLGAISQLRVAMQEFTTSDFGDEILLP
jgi:aspartate/methionine/tyrosine aminotransferase